MYTSLLLPVLLLCILSYAFFPHLSLPLLSLSHTLPPSLTLSSLCHPHRDLNPDNVLLDMSGNYKVPYSGSHGNIAVLYIPPTIPSPSGQAVLTYFGRWDFVESQEKMEPAERLYVAPGVS